MSERLVSPEVSREIARQVRDEFRAALAETASVSAKMDQQQGLKTRRPSPPPGSAAAVRAPAK